MAAVSVKRSIGCGSVRVRRVGRRENCTPRKRVSAENIDLVYVQPLGGVGHPHQKQVHSASLLLLHYLKEIPTTLSCYILVSDFRVMASRLVTKLLLVYQFSL